VNISPVLQGLFAGLAPWLQGCPARPDTRWLAQQITDAALGTRSGQRLVLQPPRADGLGYEERIWRTGQVETRPDNWHDFFNGLVWLAYPRAKAALNARHMACHTPGQRGAARDAMTHLDECGILVASSDPELLELIRGFQWKRLFWEERARLPRHLAFHVFGHATFESLLKPHRGLTAKAVLYQVPRDWHDLSLSARRADLDRRLAADIDAGCYCRPRDLQPLPLLGIPGLVAENAGAAYYDDAWQFRSGRRDRPAPAGV